MVQTESTKPHSPNMAEQAEVPLQKRMPSSPASRQSTNTEQLTGNRKLEVEHLRKKEMELSARRRHRASQARQEQQLPSPSHIINGDVFRWPPVGHSVTASVSKGHPMTEGENLPLPYIIREQCVDVRQWDLSDRLRSKPSQQGWTALNRNSFPVDQDPEDGHKSRQRRRLWPISPFSKFARSWQVLITLVDATYSAFLIPIAIAFNWNDRYFSWYNGIDIAAGACFWLDIVFNFSTGFVLTYNLKRRVIMSPSEIARFYMNGSFMWDVISALPVIAEITVVCVDTHGSDVAYHVINLMRLARLIRVYNMLLWMIRVSLAGQLNWLVLRWLSAGHMFLLDVLYAGFVLINLLACAFYYTATWEGLENSWLTSTNDGSIDLSGANPVRQWVAAVYYTTATITTVGYGDISAGTAAEQLVSCAMMLVGILVFGFVISSSTELMRFLCPSLRRLGLLREKIETVDIWLQERNISNALATRVHSYISEVWLQQAELNVQKVFCELPTVLQADVAFEACMEILKTSSMFKPLNEETQRLVAARMRPQIFAAGHDLCRQGDDADCMWILSEGEVLSIRHGKELELIVHPAVVGEAAMLADDIPALRHRPYTFRAVSFCEAWQLTTRDMSHIFELHPDVKRTVLESFRGHLASAMTDPDILFIGNDWDEVLQHIKEEVLVDDDGGAMVPPKGEVPDTPNATALFTNISQGAGGSDSSRGGDLERSRSI